MDLARCHRGRNSLLQNTSKLKRLPMAVWPVIPLLHFQPHRLNSFIMLSYTHLFVLSSLLWLLQVALVSLTTSQEPMGAYTKWNVDENGLIAIYTALRLAPWRCCLQRKHQWHVELCLKTPQSKSIKAEIWNVDKHPRSMDNTQTSVSRHPFDVVGLSNFAYLHKNPFHSLFT